MINPWWSEGLRMEEGSKFGVTFEILKTRYFLNILTNEGGVKTGFCSAEQADFKI